MSRKKTHQHTHAEENLCLEGCTIRNGHGNKCPGYELSHVNANGHMIEENHS